ncbi:cytochrome b ascorbate-dependent protein 3-like [Nannospalax galili]|uniref:cytochrome b ascorbate-dependent protein 3-like n=1 Tax=Nannospalax galili TaxID=1026970 RepID=UPI00111C6081|nr:cytochrome b ascorbate-dependent protein 3-like [Nannospalax galili]
MKRKHLSCIHTAFRIVRTECQVRETAPSSLTGPSSLPSCCLPQIMGCPSTSLLIGRLCGVSPGSTGSARGCGQTLGLFSSAASLVYRLPLSWVGPKLPWKLLHAALHLLAFIFTVVGLVAVFQYHNHSKIAHLYSLHSWLGITTVILFACQWFLGFSIFLLPWASQWLRSLLKPVHVFFGACILSLSITSVISGINEKIFFVL